MANSSLKPNASGATQEITFISDQSFSVLSPYLTTCRSGKGDPVLPDDDIINRKNLGYDPRYLKTPPLHSLPEGMPNLIRQELGYIFFETTALYLRHEDDYKIWWHREGSMTCLDTPYLPIGFVERKRVYQFLNKELIVYFETTSVCGPDSVSIVRYIYREWLHLHHGRPPFQRDGFFAKAVQIGKNGPQSLQQLSACHRRICQQASNRLDDLVDFYPRTRSRRPRPPFFEPIPSKKIQSWRDSGYTLRHLFRALYIVVDRKSLEEPLEIDPIWRDDGTTAIPLDEIHRRRFSRCTVLLVKTGDEAHLHSPISFLPLFDAGLALNVNRVDYHDNMEETVVRVTLEVAVHFVWELLCKEEDALEGVRQSAEGLRQERDTFCDAWVERVMSHSRRVGIDNNEYAWLAIRRALARMNNEAFEEDQVEPMWEQI